MVGINNLRNGLLTYQESYEKRWQNVKINNTEVKSGRRYSHDE